MADTTQRCRADAIPEETVAATVERQLASIDPQRAASYAGLQSVRTARAGGLAREQKRLALKYGDESPRVQAVAARTVINQGLLRDLDFELARASREAPTVDARGYVLHGFVRNLSGQGLPQLTVALYDEKGNWLRELGQGCSDEHGYFLLRYQGKENDPASDSNRLDTASLAANRPTARIHVFDAEQKTVQIEAEPLQPRLGQVDFRIIVIGAQSPPCPPPPATTAPTPEPTPPPTPSPTPAPTPTPTPRTSLARLDIDEATRKRLIQAGIIDVEDILETSPDKLAEILGSRELALRLIERARALLTGSPSGGTSLDKLGLDDPLRRRLEQGGIRTVEGILAADPARLSDIVGDTATARKLRERAKAVIDGGG
ncbi:MAG: hypothetical protein ER33_05035 [Cyanobium sp. CACIAM 14]|nr:MAG: hypothetical protein ER33_05035 [Cyanobium sp. CACIAM 14]